METLGPLKRVYWGYIGIIGGLFWGYLGITEKNMETTIATTIVQGSRFRT